MVLGGFAVVVILFVHLVDGQESDVVPQLRHPPRARLQAVDGQDGHLGRTGDGLFEPTQPPRDRRNLGIPRSTEERAHNPPILNKFIYYLSKISEFCPQNLSAKSWQDFRTLEF